MMAVYRLRGLLLMECAFSGCKGWRRYVWLGACFLVIAFRVAIVATIREWVNSESDVACSRVPVDLEVRE